MSYQALYRQWRPLDFDEVIGQSHIVGPLKNQIVSETYGHAYLFSGTRGTGKTSTAKILARAVNCLNQNNGNPCNQCENCLSILEDQFIDVVEMDAASNNSVDDIRELREHVKFAPSKGKFKVYIIDEVHMLSQGAFNALLKTLEEPPRYVIFILATTESQKIPQTILSRCQKYDFKRVSYSDILKRLQYICEKIEVTYELEALEMIIEKSDGAVRDSLSSLDQCLSTSGNQLTRDAVIETLGIVEKTQLITLVQFLATKQSSEVLQTINSVLGLGKDLTQFLNGLISIYRDLLVVKMVKDNHTQLIQASKEYVESLKDISEDISINHVSRALDLLIDLSKTFKFSQNKRIVFETTLVKLLNPQCEQSYEALLERIERLEKGIPQEIPQGNPRGVLQEVSHVIPEEKEPVKESGIDAFIEFREGDVTLDDVNAIWQTFLSSVSDSKKSLYPFLEGSKPVQVTEHKCTVGLTPNNKLFIGVLNNPSNSQSLNALFSRCIKKNIALEYTVNEKSEKPKMSESEQVLDYFKAYKDVLEIK